jgi:hypothetical protein
MSVVAACCFEAYTIKARFGTSIHYAAVTAHNNSWTSPCLNAVQTSMLAAEDPPNKWANLAKALAELERLIDCQIWCVRMKLKLTSRFPPTNS